MEDCVASLEPVLRLARGAASGDVSEAVHQRGKERLVLLLERRRALPPARLWPAFAVAGLCALAAALFFAWPAPRLGFTLEGGGAADGSQISPAPGAASTVRFSDGTAITFEDGARGRVAEVSERGATLELDAGAADVRVVHRRAARWLIKAGEFKVEVIGTKFTVSWSAADGVLDVRMREGAVIVRGPLAPHGLTLSAGQHLVANVPKGDLQVTADAAASRPPGALSAPPEASRTLPASAITASSQPSAPAALSWAKRVAAGDYNGVLADAETRGLDDAINLGSAADLIALADAARYAGRSGIATRALLAMRARFPGTDAARRATFLLGRIVSDSNGDLASAITYYDQYLAESPRGPLAAEALGRKMVAVRQISGPAAARPVAEAYLERYPEGPYAHVAASLIGRAPH